jgi:AcrR family transcriptional regulator
MTLDQTNTKRESGDDRRLAIAAAARAIIVEKGLEGLRTRDIAKRVGINIATLHINYRACCRRNAYHKIAGSG